ncbi:MAG: hypothetical protein JKX94_04295 [Sneathiella sp.]|nr:hypothetical protein [Sneathiella sp.]
MEYRRYTKYSLLALGLLVGACEDVDRIDQKELLSKVDGLTSPQEIVAAIGPADDIDRDGALEQWRYMTNEKDVCFMVAGKVALRMVC